MNKKYKLSNKFITFDNIKLYRIKALRDGPWGKKGIFGGYVESEKNLSHNNDCWIYNSAKIFGNAQVYDNAQVFGNTKIFGNAKVYENAQIFGNVQIHGNTQISGNVIIYESVYICGCIQINDSIFYGNVIIKYNYTKYPYCIQGSRHIVNYIGNIDNKPIIKIGCMEYTLNYWLENYKRIGINNNYTCEEIEEYEKYLILLKSLLEGDV